MQKNILVCVDNSSFAKDACDYGIFLSKKLQIPLLLLHVIEHSHTSKTTNLSGNIGLGSQENLLEKLAEQEHIESKNLIKKGKEVLNELKEYASKHDITVKTLQKHGALDETLQEVSNQTQIAIIGIKGEDSGDKTIGAHVEDIIRSLDIPLLLVSRAFTPINTIMMAYDGSNFANKAIKNAAQNPLFQDASRHIVNVNKDTNISQRLLNEAKKLFESGGIDVKTASLNGDPLEQLLEYKRANSIDLIVMGAYSHNRLKSAIFGSFTSKMLQNSACALLLFR